MKVKSEREAVAHTTDQNLGNILKAVLSGKCMVLNACARKGKMSQIRDLRFYLRKLEKKAKIFEQTEEGRKSRN